MGVYIKGATIEDLLNLCMVLEPLYADGKMVEFKAPHGRLVDIDAVADMFWDCTSMEINNDDMDSISVVIEAEVE